MEHTNPPVSKSISNILRVIFFMLRKSLTSKGKLIVDLNKVMTRGKMAGKAIHNLMFPHTNRRETSATRDYEFNCSNTPAFPFIKNRHSHFFSCVHAPPTDEDVVTANVKMALEILNSAAASPTEMGIGRSPVVATSPWLPGFGWSPAVGQLRITDSPFPLQEVDEDRQVDDAAEEFIMKFYKDLRKQT